MKPTSSEGVAYVNGQYLPLAEAVVPVTDRGFLFADSVYELIPVYLGHAFRLGAHLDRLARSLAAVGIDAPLTREQWQAVIGDLIERAGSGELSVYLQVTRGAAPRDHVPPAGLTPNVVAFATAAPDRAPNPVTAITLPDRRWDGCDIKSTSLLANVLARRAAAESDAREAILLRGAVVTEGAASNVFIVRSGKVRTPPLSNHLLPGITRQVVIEVLARLKIELVEESVVLKELRDADEIWLCSSSREVVPVTCLDGKQVGTGEPGAYFQFAWKGYQLTVDEECGRIPAQKQA